MSNILVKGVVCDYGVYEDDKLIYIFNDRENAKLVKEILEKDSKYKRYRLNEEKIDLLEFLDELSGDDRNTFYNLLDEMKLKEEEIKVIKEVN